MKKLKVKLNEMRHSHPILLCIILTVVFILLLQVTSMMGLLDIPYDAALIGAELLLAISVIGLVYLMNERSIFSDRKVGFFRGLIVGAFMLVYQLLGLVAVIFLPDFQGISLQQMLVSGVFCLMVGLAEEVCFRGLVTNLLAQHYAKNRRGIYFTVFVSGAIFGVMHLINIFAGASLMGTFIQVVATIGMGWFFSAVYLRTGNIWVVIFLHAFQNFVAFSLTGVTSGTESITGSVSDYSWTQLISIVIYLVPTLFLLRKSKSAGILQRYRGASSTQKKNRSQMRVRQDVA